MKNSIIQGDNLQILSNMEDESVDLIYLDPPFNSNKNYICVGEKGNDNYKAQVAYFKDVWKSMDSYIEFLEVRLIEMRRILKPTGSLYLHCDSTMSHYIKRMMDKKVFGIKNYRNEIIWHYRRWTGKANRLQKLHDIIFFYTKSNNYNYNVLFTDYTDGSKSRKEQGILNRFKNGEKHFVSNGELDPKGVRMGDVWVDIPFIAPSAKERLGYPTQKPIKLLERIIKASSNEGDIVLDPFMGSGTTLDASAKLNRNFVGIDMHPEAVEITIKRLGSFGIKPEILKAQDVLKVISEEIKKSYEEIRTYEELRGLDHFDYQNKTVTMIGGFSNPKKTGDMGIDGWHGDNGLIQVKQSENVGRDTADKLITTVLREGKEYGIIIAVSFAKSLYDYVESEKIKKITDIILMTEREIFEGNFHPKSTDLDFELSVDYNDKDGNFIKVENTTQKVINYTWWIDKGNDPFFEGEDLKPKPCKVVDMIGRLIISKYKKIKEGKNTITCMAVNEYGEEKTKEMEYFHT